MSERTRMLEVGRVLGTHGIRGELRLEPWCDSPEVLRGLDRLTLGSREYRVIQARVHKSQVICRLEGIDTVEAAMALFGKIVLAERGLIPLPPGRFFVCDLLGLTVVDDKTGETVGKLAEVIPNPAHSIYRVVGERERLIPAVDAFIKKTDLENGVIHVELIEGM